MFASIRQYQTDSPNELIRRLNREYIPMASKAKGLIAHYAINAGTDTVLSVSVFQTEAEATESNQRAAAWFERSALPVAASSHQVMVWQ
ncbi:MAG TPA: hypothetical protein VHP11_12670 [Tepidisphaeraceae bacterium]|nr:hypothetical protein [Tepidisphaeraceae bacterium]